MKTPFMSRRKDIINQQRVAKRPWWKVLKIAHANALDLSSSLLFSLSCRHLTNRLSALAARNIERSWGNAKYRCWPRKCMYECRGASGTFIIREWIFYVGYANERVPGAANRHEHLETTVRLQRAIIFRVFPFFAASKFGVD